MQNSFHRFRFLSAVVALLLTYSASAQSFTLSLNGKPVGTAQVTEKETASGYLSTATGSVRMEGLTLSFSRTCQLDKKSELLSSHLSGVVNGQAVTVQLELQPKTESAPAQFSMATSANGQKSTSGLEYHPHTVLLPDFDPGALQTLIDVADQNNYRGLWVLIPKQQGQVYAAKIATLADEKGTLDGKSVKVHHLQLIYNDEFLDLFLSEHVELLQAESVANAYAIVRKGFVLKPISKPGSAPQQPDTQ